MTKQIVKGTIFEVIVTEEFFRTDGMSQFKAPGRPLVPK